MKWVVSVLCFLIISLSLLLWPTTSKAFLDCGVYYAEGNPYEPIEITQEDLIIGWTDFSFQNLHWYCYANRIVIGHDAPSMIWLRGNRYIFDTYDNPYVSGQIEVVWKAAVSHGSDVITENTVIRLYDNGVQQYEKHLIKTQGPPSPFPAIPIPTNCQSFTYSSAILPVLNADPPQAKPIGLGAVAEGGDTLSIKVNTYQFSDPVDIYFGLYSPEIDPDIIYLLTSGGAFQKLSESMAPWKANTTGPVDESLIGNIQVSSLPIGAYYLYLLVTPTGNLSNYYLWITSFSSCNSLKFTPEGTTLFYDSISRLLEFGAFEQITFLTTACGDSVTVSSVTKTQGGEWLSASSGGGSKLILNLDAGASGVQPESTYTGTLKVVAGGITDNMYVTLQVPQVHTQCDATSASVSPASLTFSEYVGGSTPSAQTVSIEDNCGDAVSATVVSHPDFVTLTPQTSSTGVFSISCVESYLDTVGSYSGSMSYCQELCMEH